MTDFKGDPEALFDDRVAKLTQRNEAMKKDLAALRRQLGRTQLENEELRDQLHLITRITDHIPDPPTWLAPEPPGKHVGTPLFIMSDNHLGEVVRPEEIGGVNAYDIEIAHLRMKRAFEGAVTLPNHYVGTSLKKEGIVFAHCGDLFTGEIHDELAETNELSIPETLLEFLDDMVAGIKLLREEYGKVHVVEVEGNHDRFHRKVRAKRRTRSSWSYLFWQLVARELKRYKSITFQIPEGPDAIFPIYDTRFHLQHGDQNRGGSGIAGPVTPIAIGQFRKMRKHMNARAMTGNDKWHFDVMIQGHVHHRNSIPGLMTVGAMKGYDEYASRGNFNPEPASAELLIITPERGVTFDAPIWVQEPEDEGWAHKMANHVPDMGDAL